MTEPDPLAPAALELGATVEPGRPSWWHFTLTGANGSATVDFGDGESSTLDAGVEAFDHVYLAPGDYAVTAFTASQGPVTLDVTAAGASAVVTPGELEALLGLDEAEAKRVAALVQLTVEAYIWPTLVPAPVPPPMHTTGLALAARFSGATLTKAGAVVGETIGAYSYRLASPLTFDNVVAALGDLAENLRPWAPFHSRVYDLDTSPAWLGEWPADYWQRDLDRLLAPAVPT